MEQSSKNINVINTEENFFNYFDITTPQTWTTEKSFEKRTCVKPYISTQTKMQLPQHYQTNYYLQSDINDGIKKLLQTPPMMIKSALVPKVPIKKKKQFMCSELKPKKLTYEDEEFYEINNGDSGVIFDSDCSLNIDGNSENCNMAKCNIFNCDRNLENLSNIKVVTQDINVRNEPKIIKTQIKNAELNKKINENNISRIQEIANTCKNTKKNIITKTACIKKSANNSKKSRNICEKKESGITDSLYAKENEHNHNILVLSQYNGSGEWQEKLQWLQSRRDVGMWIKCCQKDCKKWRYTEDYHDPLDVPVKWYCEMNSDTKIASCTIPEICKTQEIEDDLIENKYNAGSIVWAKRNNDLWWPAMVDDCPFIFQYYKLKRDSIIPIMYHVIFFDEELVHSWHKCQHIKPFSTTENDVFLKKPNCSIMYTIKLRRSYNLAYTATSMTILERLRRYSFLSRYNFKEQLNNDENNNTVSIINCKSTDKRTVKTSYDNNKRLSTVSSTNIIDSNDIIPSSQPELDTTIKMKKKKTQI